MSGNSRNSEHASCTKAVLIVITNKNHCTPNLIDTKKNKNA